MRESHRSQVAERALGIFLALLERPHTLLDVMRRLAIGRRTAYRYLSVIKVLAPRFGYVVEERGGAGVMRTWRLRRPAAP